MDHITVLDNYVHYHTKQGEGDSSIDLIFFHILPINNPTATKLKELLSNTTGVDLLDGAEHSYIEIGAWIGDQGEALALMGLGTALGLWSLLSPRMIPGIPEDLIKQMAGQGMLSIQCK